MGGSPRPAVSSAAELPFLVATRWSATKVNDRDRILARIHTALGDTKGRGQHTLERTAVERAYRGPQGPGDLDLFVARVSDYGAGVHRVSEADVAGQVGILLTRRSAGQIVVPEGFPARWSTATDDGIELIGDEPALSRQKLDTLDGVMTTCSVAVAETGTIVLDHGPGQGRRALTLLPDYHLVVVRATQVLQGVVDAVRAVDRARTTTWISGPSATSDIELNRVEGVHGPRTLDIILVA
jgi:L-lactate dehydrogenase complex protein LldG